jgi:hypothetical protein
MRRQFGAPAAMLLKALSQATETRVLSELVIRWMRMMMPIFSALMAVAPMLASIATSMNNLSTRITKKLANHNILVEAVAIWMMNN